MAVAAVRSNPNGSASGAAAVRGTFASVVAVAVAVVVVVVAVVDCRSAGWRHLASARNNWADNWQTAAIRAAEVAAGCGA